jgi:hypothetical protein
MWLHVIDTSIGSVKGYVYFGGDFPQVGGFDVLMRGVGVHLDIVESLKDVMDCLRNLCVSCGV